MKAVRQLLLTLACAGGLLGCGGGSVSTAGQAASNAAGATEVVREGDLSLRVQAVQTDLLPEPVASAYGVRRSRGEVLVLVALRQGADAVATSPAAQVDVEVRDLLGRSRQLQLQTMAAGELIDHVGTLRITPPETLAITVKAQPQAGPPLQLTITRDFLP